MKNRFAVQGLLYRELAENFFRMINNYIKESGLTDKEIKETLEPKIEEMILKYEENISSLYLEKQKFDIDGFLGFHFKVQRNIVERNKDSFFPFILYIDACSSAFNKVVENAKGKRVDIILSINLSLYGLVIRRAHEIQDLLMGGYIDGAMIIWRSMYENAVSLLTLAKENNKELSKRFYDHSIRNSQRKISAFNENHELLKFPPLPKKTLKQLDKGRLKLLEKYGKEFLNNDYGWADILFKGFANFKSLEERLELKKYRPFYTLCCEQIHSSYNGFNHFMKDDKLMIQTLFAREIELKSFIDPMQFTIRILEEVNEYFFRKFSTEDESEANILLLRKITQKLQDSFKQNQA